MRLHSCRFDPGLRYQQESDLRKKVAFFVMFFTIFAAMRMRTLGHRIAAMLSITLMLAGCGNLTSPRPSPRGEGGACRTLTGIDSLMWQQPDSAFALLQAFAASPEADSLDVFNGHYFQLLVAELLYKNDYLQTNRPGLLQAVAYFDSLTSIPNERTRLQRLMAGTDPPSPTRDDLVFLTARAHYINGVGYYEHDSVVEACAEYLKAWEQMEECSETKEADWRIPKFMALILTRLADIFSDMYLHEQAIYFAQLSLPYYQKWGEPSWYMSRMLCEVGSQYNMLNELDSAEYYYQQAHVFLPDTNTLIYRDLMTHSAFLSYKSEHHPKEPLDILYRTLKHVDSDSERFSRCLTIGEIYYHERQYDSAWKYLGIVYENTEIKALKKQAAEWLIEICKIQGKESDILGYAGFLIPFANQEENQSEVKSQLTELYKDFWQKHQERKHQHVKEQYTKWTVIVVGGLLAMMSFVVSLYFRNKRKGEHLKVQIKEEKHFHEQQQKALSGKLKKTNEELRKTLEQMENERANKVFSYKSRQMKDYDSFMSAPVCQQILEVVHDIGFKSKINYVYYKEYALQKGQILALRVAADEYMDCFTTRVRKRYPSLTDEDVNYCCLYLLGLNEADISALMQKAYPTVCERKRKIRRIIGEQDDVLFTLRNLM